MKAPTIDQQNAYWQRKEEEYQAYLEDLHRQQQDPEYVASYKAWLDQIEPLPWDGEDIEDWQRQSERQGD